MTTRRCRLFHVDAFTRERFCGNPARVVLDADDLSDEQMQTIATELNGETAFVLAPESNDHDVNVRFFAPKHEVPFVGHATIATQYVLAKTAGRKSASLRQRSKAGIGEVEIYEADGDLRVAISSSAPSLGPVLPDKHRQQVLDALGISTPSLLHAAPLQILAKGSTRLLIGLKSADLLSSIKPDFDELTRLTPHVGADGYFVFAITSDGRSNSTASRMFCPALGIPEDPVSGNAHGMLGAYLVAHELMEPAHGALKFMGSQGQWMRRPGNVDVEVVCMSRVAQSVRIAGDAVILYEAEL